MSDAFESARMRRVNETAKWVDVLARDATARMLAKAVRQGEPAALPALKDRIEDLGPESEFLRSAILGRFLAYYGR